MAQPQPTLNLVATTLTESATIASALLFCHAAAQLSSDPAQNGLAPEFARLADKFIPKP